MKNIIAVDSHSSREYLYLQYMFTNVCNYKCWYCFPGSNEGTHRWPDIDLIKANFGHLVDHYKKNGKTKIVINLTGGEPTLWPALEEFVAHFREKGCVFSLITNGSRTEKWWRANSGLFDRVAISVHHEFSDVEHIKEVADICYDNSTVVEAQVLMDPTNWHQCVNLVEKLRDSRRRWMISAKEVLIDEKIIYDQEQRKYFKFPIKRWPNVFYFLKNNKLDIKRFSVTFEDGKKHRVGNNSIVVNDWNHFKGWECDLGVESIFINTQGTISGTCGEYLYGLDNLYNINDSDFIYKFSPEIRPTICTKESCLCVPESNLRKRRVIPIQTV